MRTAHQVTFFFFRSFRPGKQEKGGRSSAENSSSLGKQIDTHHFPHLPNRRKEANFSRWSKRSLKMHPKKQFFFFFPRSHVKHGLLRSQRSSTREPHRRTTPKFAYLAIASGSGDGGDQKGGTPLFALSEFESPCDASKKHIQKKQEGKMKIRLLQWTGLFNYCPFHPLFLL